MKPISLDRRSQGKPMSQAQARTSQSGFSLVELMVAITVTLIIMGSVYGLIAQGQSAFGREPLLSDRQQQIRIAMDRIQRDVIVGGMSLGNYFETFTPGLNAVVPAGGTPVVGYNAAANPAKGGGDTDALEIRSMASECALVRLAPSNTIVAGPHLVGNALQNLDSFWSPLPAPQQSCFPDPGWVFLLYPDGRAKFGWLSNHPLGTENASTFANPQPAGSQINGAASPADINCSRWFGPASPNGAVCPPFPVPPPPPEPGNCPACPPFAIQAAEIVRYQIGFDATDGVVGLYRSPTGGMDPAGTLTDPPNAAGQWQLVARGVEDLQVEYLSINSQAAAPADPWLDTPAPILDNVVLGPETAANPGNFGNVVIGVRVTLWARAVGQNFQVAGNVGDRLQGESRALGNQVQAVRSSLVSSMAPRAAQAALTASAQWR